MRASATATCLFVVLAVTAMVTFTAIAESRRRGHWCSSPRFVVTTYAAINSYEWRAAGRSAPRPPSLRVRHACIDFARHVHRLHLSRIRPSGPGFTTRSNTSGDPDSLRILRRSRHRGAAPASRCEARMRLWRRTRQTEMFAFAQGPNVRAGCLAIPSARPRPLLLCLRRQHRFFHFDAVQTGKS